MLPVFLNDSNFLISPDISRISQIGTIIDPIWYGIISRYSGYKLDDRIWKPTRELLKVDQTYSRTWRYIHGHEGIFTDMKVYLRTWRYIHGHEGIFTDMKVYSRTWRYIYKLLCLSFVSVLSHCLCMMSFILYLWTRLIHGHEGIFLNLLSILLTICLLLYIIFA